MLIDKSETLGELFKALALFQTSMPIVPQTKKNPFFKSTYADLSTLWDKAGRLAAKQGLSVSQFPLSTEDGRIGVMTILGHSSGEYMTSSYYLKPTKTDAQAAGSTITYARRQSLAAALGLSSEEDDDGNNASVKAPAAKKKDEHIDPTKPKDPATSNASGEAWDKKDPIFKADTEKKKKDMLTYLKAQGVDGAVLPACLSACEGIRKSQIPLTVAKFKGSL